MNKPAGPLGFRPSPESAEFLEQISVQENVSKSTIVDWCVEHGRHHLADLTDRKASFGDQLVNEYGADAILTGHVRPGALWEGTEHDPESLGANVKINGQETEFVSAKIVSGRRVRQLHLVICAAKNPTFPDLVLDTFQIDEPLGMTAERVGNVAWLPLLDGPGNGEPSLELIARRRGAK